MMDKNIECKIVQDLLLGYHDDILNTDSKKLVETHIRTCEKCKEKLASINEELDKNQVNESQIIDYIKKYRRKGLIKSILIAFFIIFFFVTTLFLREYAKVNDFIIKREKTLQADNIYSERRKIGGDTISIFKNYYKDGKQKQTVGIYNDSGEQTSLKIYRSIDSNEEIVVNENEELYSITKMDEVPNEITLKVESNYLSNIYNFKEKLALLKDFKIDKDETELYWILIPRDNRANKMEIWINRSTGLVEKEIYYNITEAFFNESNIIKNIEETIDGYVYFYDFDIVEDNDVQVPNYRLGDVN